MATNKLRKRKQSRPIPLAVRLSAAQDELAFWRSDDMKGPASIERNAKYIKWLEGYIRCLGKKIDGERAMAKGNNGLPKRPGYHQDKFWHFVGRSGGVSVQSRLIGTESSRPADMEDKAQAGFVYNRAVWFPRGNKYDPAKMTKANERARRLRQIAKGHSPDNR